MNGIADRRERISQLVSQHGEELILLPIGFLERLLDSRPFHDLALQHQIGALHLQIRLLQRGVQRLKLAGLLFLQCDVRLGQALIGLGQMPVKDAQLAPLAI